MVFSWPVIAKLIALSVALGLGYAAWNVGILHGNVSLLAASLYAGALLGAGGGTAQRRAVVVVLAGRRNGVRRLPALLAGDPALKRRRRNLFQRRRCDIISSRYKFRNDAFYFVQNNSGMGDDHILVVVVQVVRLNHTFNR
jgi:hypothetical protein